MPDALARPVGSLADPDHDHRRERERYGVEQPCLHCGQVVRLDDLRLPQLKPAADCSTSGEHHCQEENVPVPENTPETHLADRSLASPVRVETCEQPHPFVGLQPCRITWTVAQHYKADHAEHD